MSCHLKACVYGEQTAIISVCSISRLNLKNFTIKYNNVFIAFKSAACFGPIYRPSSGNTNKYIT